MKHARSLLSILAITGALAAQPPQPVQVIVPDIPSLVNIGVPFTSGMARYQQWYSPVVLQNAVPTAMRVTQLEFFCGSPPTSQAAQIDCEVWMGHGNPSLSANFASNYSSPPILVKPRANVPLTASAVVGASVLTLPFTTRFNWDRVRPIVFEVRVHGNSQGSQPFAYNFRGSTSSLGVTSRVFAGGSPVALTGSVLSGTGLRTRLYFTPGALVNIGPPGCAGEGGFVPAASVLSIPTPGTTWVHELNNAASQRACLWILGATQQQFDLLALLGLPSSNCILTNDFVNTLGAVTVGGGAGGGFAQIPVPLPAVTSYLGASVYTQWLVLDPLAPNGVLALSNSHLSVVF
jgi:hypothetical protein